ncbi:MAG: choice-of-anchor B family protein [Bacteroidota bacterium]
MIKALFYSLLFLLTLSAFSQIPCVNGKSGDNDCFGVNLQGRISAPDLGAEELNGVWVNDIWGWVDPDTGKEYALVGMTNGTSFVDVSDPTNPVVLGVLPEHNSIDDGARILHDDGAKSQWRDIKVYQNHAYIVSEDLDHGIQVFDLTQLRNVENPSKDFFFAESGHYAELGQSHNLAINEETGFLYAVGFRQQGDYQCNGGGLHIVDLSDPKNPVFAGCFDEDGYTHDTQCVIYHGPDARYTGLEICFNANEDEVVLVNVVDKNAIELLSKTSYNGVGYVHQGWLTEDHRYFIQNDELDENGFRHNTRSYIWDMLDLENPVLLDYFEHDTRSIDHNLYIEGKYIYESNYSSGLIILDTTGISGGQLRKVAFFDTYVSNNELGFVGSWSNYPFLPSGNILVSDIANGLFVVKMQTAFVSEQPKDVTACLGQHINIPLIAEGEGLSYQWQLDQGDGFKDITNFERYANSRTATLHAHALSLSQHENQYRCIISNDLTEIISDTMTVFVIDSPRAAFDVQILDSQGEVQFINNSQVFDAAFWDFGDGNISTEDFPIHRYQESGQYEVELVVQNECTLDTLLQLLDLVILAASGEVQGFHVFPTMVDQTLTLAEGKQGEMQYAIYSMNGRILTQGLFEEEITLQISAAPGTYLVRIGSDVHTQTTKVVVK